MEKAIFTLTRDNVDGLTTLGEIEDHLCNHFCFTLEDIARPYGVKDYGMTAIPANEEGEEYYLRVMPSGKYGKAVTVYTDMEGDVPVLEYGGIKFSYIRWHGGNKHEHSHGCVLVNKNRDIKKNTAWGSMLEESVAYIEKLTEEGYDCRLRVINKPQQK
jgi:hypothetical protein